MAGAAVLTAGVALWVAHSASKDTRAAIMAANRTAENDLYRATLADLAGSVAAAMDDKTSSDGRQASMRCRGLLVVLPREEFPLNVTRTFFRQPGFAPPDPAAVEAAASQDALGHILTELAAAVARLHSRSLIVDVSATARGSSHLSGTLTDARSGQ